MQRDRARERMERARRQWELEHANMDSSTQQQQQKQQQLPGTKAAGGTATTTSSTPGSATTPKNNGMNHIGATAPGASTAVSTADAIDGIPGFPSLVSH